MYPLCVCTPGISNVLIPSHAFSRFIPCEHGYDVVVGVGGPGGCGAAISAARKGARVLLIEAEADPVRKEVQGVILHHVPEIVTSTPAMGCGNLGGSWANTNAESHDCTPNPIGHLHSSP